MPLLLVLRLVFHLDHLASPVAPTALAHPVRAHQLTTLLAQDQSWCVEALVLAAVTAAMARNFILRYGTHSTQYSL